MEKVEREKQASLTEFEKRKENKPIYGLLRHPLLCQQSSQRFCSPREQNPPCFLLRNPKGPFGRLPHPFCQRPTFFITPLGCEAGRNEKRRGSRKALEGANNTQITTLPIFKLWRNSFYRFNVQRNQNSKTYQPILRQVVTSPLMLAIWIMADGSTDSSVKINKDKTLRFNSTSLRLHIGDWPGDRLTEDFFLNFNIITKVQETDPNDKRLIFQMDQIKHGKKKKNKHGICLSINLSLPVT